MVMGLGGMGRPLFEWHGNSRFYFSGSPAEFGGVSAATLIGKSRMMTTTNELSDDDFYCIDIL